MRRTKSTVIFIASVFLVGCGGSDLPPMGKVDGVVQLDGNPLPDAVVTLTPLAGGRPARGTTDAQGTFEVSTFSMGDGALAGEHSVVINPKRSPPASYFINPNATRGYEPPFPSRYWSKNSSDLTATVEANVSNELKLELVTD